MCDRVDGKIGAKETPIGLMPKDGDLDLAGLDISGGDMKALMDVDLTEWRAEASDIEKYFPLFGSRMPARLMKQLVDFKKRLG
jgi:phosphoenolpyruvate carboxykinase (GTP)